MQCICCPDRDSEDVAILFQDYLTVGSGTLQHLLYYQYFFPIFVSAILLLAVLDYSRLLERCLMNLYSLYCYSSLYSTHYHITHTSNPPFSVPSFTIGEFPDPADPRLPGDLNSKIIPPNQKAICDQLSYSHTSTQITRLNPDSRDKPGVRSYCS